MSRRKSSGRGSRSGFEKRSRPDRFKKTPPPADPTRDAVEAEPERPNRIRNWLATPLHAGLGLLGAIVAAVTIAVVVKPLTAVVDNHIDTASGDQWILTRILTPTSPERSAYVSLVDPHRSNLRSLGPDAVDVGSSEVNMEVTGYLHAGIRIDDAYIRIIARAPVEGGTVYLPIQPQATPDDVAVAANLDAEKPQLFVRDTDGKPTRRLMFGSKTVTLAYGDRTVFSIYAVDTSSLVSWEIVFNVIDEANGKTRSIVVDNSGKPWRTTGSLPAVHDYSSYYVEQIVGSKDQWNRFADPMVACTTAGTAIPC